MRNLLYANFTDPKNGSGYIKAQDGQRILYGGKKQFRRFGDFWTQTKSQGFEAAEATSNLIADPYFTTALQWTLSDALHWKFNSVILNPFKKSALSGTGVLDGSNYWARSYKDITVLNSTNYALSCYVYIDENVDFTTDIDDITISTTDGFTAEAAADDTIRNRWQRILLTGTTSTTTLRINAYINGQSTITSYSGNIYFTGFQLEALDHVSPFTEGERKDTSLKVPMAGNFPGYKSGTIITSLRPDWNYDDTVLAATDPILWEISDGIYYWRLYYHGTNNRIYIDMNDGSSNYVSGPDVSFGRGDKLLIIFTWDGAKVDIWVNKERSITDDRTQIANPLPKYITLGPDGDINSIIDEFAVFDEAFTLKNVEQVYSNYIAGRSIEELVNERLILPADRIRFMSEIAKNSDARVKLETTLEYTSDARVVWPIDIDMPSDAVVVVRTDIDTLSDATVIRRIDFQYLSDARVYATSDISIPSSARVTSAGEMGIFSDARVKQVLAIDTPSDARIFATAEIDVPSDARVIVTFFIDVLSDARIVETHDIDVPSDTRVIGTSDIDTPSNATIFTTEEIIKISNANVQKRYDIDIPSNARVVRTYEFGSKYSNATIFKMSEFDKFSDSRVVNRYEIDIPSDAKVIGTYYSDKLSDARVFTTVDIDISSGARVVGTYEIDVESDARVVETHDIDKVSDAVVFAVGEMGKFSDAIVFTTNEIDKLSDALVIFRPEIDKLSDARILVPVEIDKLSDATIFATPEIDILSDAIIFKQSEFDKLSDARVVNTYDSDKLSDARVLNTYEIDTPSDAVIFKQSEFDKPSDARVLNTYYSDKLSDAKVFSIKEMGKTSDARVIMVVSVSKLSDTEVLDPWFNALDSGSSEIDIDLTVVDTADGNVEVPKKVKDSTGSYVYVQ